MVKKNREDNSWGIWLTDQKVWLEDEGRKPVSYKLQREAKKECDGLNNMWKGRKKTYEVKKFR